MKLPNTITLGGIELHRKRGTTGRLTNEWRCANNWNHLIRTRDNLWIFDGGPLNRTWGFCEPQPKPEGAFLASLARSLRKLREEYQAERTLLETTRDRELGWEP